MSACPQCRRRSWLLGALNVRLEYVGRSPTRLAALLELSDEQLIEAVGGEHRERLHREYKDEELTSGRPALPTDVQAICRHDPDFPQALASVPGAPRLLHVAGGRDRLHRLLAAPAVAIVGARAASDYGMEVAHGLARGLAASGITIVSGLAEGIATAAHEGALDVAGPTLTVCAGGIDVCHPASRRALQQRLCRAGCALAELPCGERPCSWCHVARARIVVALARLVVVVEAGERPGELLHARLACEQRTRKQHASDQKTILAAVPGRVTSPLSRGTHALLRDGAHLVRSAEDVLDAVYRLCDRTDADTHKDIDAPEAQADLEAKADKEAPAAADHYAAAVRHQPPAPQPASLEPKLRALLDQVAAGRDTVASLLAAGAAEQETLIGLARLECSGAVVRGDAGRYVPRL